MKRPQCFEDVMELDRRIRGQKVIDVEDFVRRRRARGLCAVFFKGGAAPLGGGTPVVMGAVQ